MTFDPTSVVVTWDSTQRSLYPSPIKLRQSMWIQWLFFFQKLESKVVDPLMTFDPKSVEVTQGSLCPSPMKKYQSLWLQWPFFFQKLEPKIIDPYMTFDPSSVEVTCVTLREDHYVQVWWEYFNVCGYSDQFCKTSTKITTYYIHTYYVQNEWSLSGLSSGETITIILLCILLHRWLRTFIHIYLLLFPQTGDTEELCMAYKFLAQYHMKNSNLEMASDYARKCCEFDEVGQNYSKEKNFDCARAMFWPNEYKVIGVTFFFKLHLQKSMLLALVDSDASKSRPKFA